MKKTIIAVIAVIFFIALVGCGGKRAPNKVFSEDDLTGKEIGVVEGSAATVFAAGYGTLHAYKSAETMLVDLKNDIIDCAVMDKDIARLAMRKVHGLKTLKEPFIEADFCFAVAKENPDLTKDVNKALRILDESGTLEDIHESYKGESDYVYISPSGVDRSVGTLTIAFDGRFPPYSYESGSGAVAGLDVDVARAVCDILHVDMIASIVPGEELITTVQYGKADLSLGGIPNNEEDADLVDFTDPYSSCTQVIVVRK